jgi:hypothetical protein
MCRDWLAFAFLEKVSDPNGAKHPYPLASMRILDALPAAIAELGATALTEVVGALDVSASSTLKIRVRQSTSKKPGASAGRACGIPNIHADLCRRTYSHMVNRLVRVHPDLALTCVAS